MSSSKIKQSNIIIPGAFRGIFKPNRYKIYYGGRGGAKSWAIATALIIIALQKPTRILCTRELQKSINDSVHRLLKDLIYKYQLDSYFEITKISIKTVNGSEFIFAGLRSNVSEIKSMEGIQICWVEEAQKVSEESWEVLIPTIRDEGSEIWLSFNPDQISDPTYKRFILSPPDGALLRKVSHADNPYFPETLRREMEYDKRVDYDKYMHIWEGEPRTISDAQVFKGKFVVDVFEAPEETTFYYGADWGFARDPSTLIRCYIDDRTLYIDHEAYGVGVDIDELPQLFRQVPGADKWPIIADSARPETISYLNKLGWNFKPSPKWAGSVEDGIAYLRSFEKIVIHERCKHTINEFTLYSYKTDKLTGEVLPIVIDAHNHCFAGDTLIITDKGEIPIKYIIPGDMVLTRNGYKRVLRKFDNGVKKVFKYRFANNFLLTATDTHNIITTDGKVEISKLSSEKLYFAEGLWDGSWRIINTGNQRLLYLTGKNSIDIQMRKEDAIGYITAVLDMIKGGIIRGSMLRSMNIIMAMCRKAIMSITKMGTLSIMNYAILKLLTVKNIYQCIAKIYLKNRKEKEKRISIELDRLQKYGTEAQRGKRGIKDMLLRLILHGRISKKKNGCVCNAGMNIHLEHITKNSVQINVNQHIDGQSELITRNEYALYVEKNLSSINIAEQKHARENAGTYEEVYNLMIEENHEYFANRILVANCIDSGRYALSKLIKNINDDVAVGIA